MLLVVALLSGHARRMRVVAMAVLPRGRQGPRGTALQGVAGDHDAQEKPEAGKVRQRWKPLLSAEGHCRPPAAWMHSSNVDLGCACE